MVKTFLRFKSIKGTLQTKSYRYVQMNLFQTISANNYVILHARFSNRTFTKYSGIRQTRLLINKGLQPKAVSVFSFIAAYYFLKPVYFSITGAVSWVQLNKLRQYNKSINVDCQNTSFFLPVRCAASYLKR